jgi:hypothetical protein
MRDNFDISFVDVHEYKQRHMIMALKNMGKSLGG